MAPMAGARAGRQQPRLLALLGAGCALTALQRWCFALPDGFSGLPVSARSGIAAPRGAAVIRRANMIEVPGGLKNGMHIVVDDEPFEVMTHQSKKQGKGVAITKAKMRNLLTGAMVDKTLQSGKKYLEAETEWKDAQYSYTNEDGDPVFMDMETWEEMTVPLSAAGDLAIWLKEGDVCDVNLYEGKITRFRIQGDITAKVVETMETSDSVSKSSKRVTLDNGAIKTGPYYLQVGDTVMVDAKNFEIQKRV